MSETPVEVLLQLALMLLGREGHDTIEDTETTPEELERLFGAGVAGVVAEVTDDKALPKAERKRLQIEHASHLSRGAKLVKLADKICKRERCRRGPAEGLAARAEAGVLRLG